jgi:hypothetical protein
VKPLAPAADVHAGPARSDGSRRVNPS